MFTNSPLHFSQRSFIKPAELFLYVFLIIASERSRIVYLTFWCPLGNNAINHLWPLLFQADICSRVTHWLSRLGLLLFPTWTDRQTDTHTHTLPLRWGQELELEEGFWNPCQLRLCCLSVRGDVEIW